MLSNVYIRNFKSFQSAEIRLSNLTLFTGSNGLGKSSFIQVLLLLRQSYNAQMLPGKGLYLDGEYVKIGTGKDAFNWNAAEEEGIYFELAWDDGVESAYQFEYRPKSNFLPLRKHDQNHVAVAAKKSLFNNQFRYLSAERISPETSYQPSDYHVNQLRTLGNRGEYTVHFIASNENEEIPIPSLSHPGARNLTIPAQISAWLSEISKGISQQSRYHPEVGLAQLVYRYETKTAGTVGLTEDIKPQNVGFGITYALPVITALVASKPGDLVIIENPESHLHPAGQAAVGRLCALTAAAGVQVIIETHSDHVLNAVRVAVRQQQIQPSQTSIWFFERPSFEHRTEYLSPHLDEWGRLDTRPQGFFDEFDIQLDKLLS